MNATPGSLSVDEVKLRRDQTPSTIYGGAFTEAWKLVKRRPAETLVLSFLYLVVGGGAGGCGTPDFGGRRASEHGQSAADAMQQAQDFFASMQFMEWAFLASVAGFALVVGLLAFVIGTVVRGGAAIYWMRLVRDQNAEFGHTVAAIHFFVPLFVASLAAVFGIGVGFALLIVPGVVLALGWFFVIPIVVDHNIGYLEALRASWRLTKGYKGQLFVFAILCGLLNLAGLLACGVGVVVTNAVVMGAAIIVYDRIANAGNAYLDEPLEPQIAG